MALFALPLWLADDLSSPEEPQPDTARTPATRDSSRARRSWAGEPGTSRHTLPAGRRFVWGIRAGRAIPMQPEERLAGEHGIRVAGVPQEAGEIGGRRHARELAAAHLEQPVHPRVL